MKRSGNQITHANVQLITAKALVATLVLAPGMTLATDKDAHKDHVELRIKYMHTKLKITAAQEVLGAKVTQAMLDDAKTMDTLPQKRIDHVKDMTAVDNLKPYGVIPMPTRQESRN